MNKQNQIIAAAIIAIIIAVGVAFFVITHRSQPQPQISNSTQKQASSEAMPETEGTMGSLLALNKNVKCDVSYSSQDVTNSGSVFVSGKKMRGDFTATVSGKNVDSHMISDGTYMYSWSSVTPDGIKMLIGNATPSPTASSVSNQGVNLNQNVKYNCSDWSVDETKFEVPTNVKFMDVSQIMKGAGNVNQTPAANSASSYCDQLTDPQAKAACLSATSK